MKVNKHIVHNFSLYVLPPEEVTVLSFGLDQHISYNLYNNTCCHGFLNMMHGHLEIFQNFHNGRNGR